MTTAGVLLLLLNPAKYAENERRKNRYAWALSRSKWHEAPEVVLCNILPERAVRRVDGIISMALPLGLVRDWTLSKEDLSLGFLGIEGARSCCSSPRDSHASDDDCLVMSPRGGREVGTPRRGETARRSKRVGRQPLKLLEMELESEEVCILLSGERISCYQLTLVRQLRDDTIGVNF